MRYLFFLLFFLTALDSAAYMNVRINDQYFKVYEPVVYDSPRLFVKGIKCWGRPEGSYLEILNANGEDVGSIYMFTYSVEANLLHITVSTGIACIQDVIFNDGFEGGIIDD